MLMRVLRLVLMALLIASGLAAGRTLLAIDRRAGALLDATDETSTRLASMTDSLAGIGAAQRSYVAPGQQAEPWFERMSSLLQQLYDDAAAVRPFLSSPGAEPAIEGLVASTEALIAADTRARENLRLGQQLMAADVIFSDGLDTLDAMIRDVRELGRAEQAAYRAEHAALAGERWRALGATAAFWTLATLILAVMSSRRSAAVPAAETEEVPAAAPLEPAPRTIDLPRAAAVCTDLSRMSTASALSDLLGRAAGVLDASGIILWLGAGEQLFAVTAHGYPPDLIGRLGALSRRDQNATASAWRTGQLTTVTGEGGASGAVVAPMFGPDACIGVLAIELTPGRDPDADTQAVARIVAAQVATGVSAWPAPSSAQSSTPQPAVSGEEYRSASGE